MCKTNFVLIKPYLDIKDITAKRTVTLSNTRHTDMWETRYY